MNPKLLHNRPLSDYENNDSFDFLIKATAIKNFLEQNTESLDQNKMLVLYGDWGSGKTSLMRHIESIINKEIYKPIFFEAWEHEKDQNLALSLCDALTENVEGNNEIVKSFMKGAFSTLKGFASGITLKSSLLTGLGIDLEFSGKEFVEKLEKSDTPSFYKSNKEFKKSFLAVEKEILKSSGAQKLLVFIDDLDRCEPEHVLNLITALKLFFTYGDKVIFFCGIDKEAVAKAVKTKYNDVIKSEEYLEKVFDISFNMPNAFSLRKLLREHFIGKFIVKEVEKDYVDVIEDFFISIKFTTPRHLKKVLTKYEMLKFFKVNAQIPPKIKELIPDIINNDSKGEIFETIYCLFMIITYEFFNKQYEDIEKYETKIGAYANLYHNNLKVKNPSQSSTNTRDAIGFHVEIPNLQSLSISQILISNSFDKFVFLFSHSAPQFFEPLSDRELTKFDILFPDDLITTNFCKFLIKHKETIILNQKESVYVFWNLFKMVKYLL